MTSRNTTRSGVWYLVVSLVLLAVLLGLGVVYYLLSKPPALATKSGDKDRHYLFSIYGFEGDLLRRPTGLTFDEQGDIHVADTGKKRVVVFDGSGNYVTTYGEAGDKELQLWEPIGVAVGADGRSYVLDKGKKKIVIFDPQHKAVKAMHFEDYPLAVTVARGRLYVAMVAGIVVFDLDGTNAITGYISRGKKPGQFDTPGGLAVASDGTIYVADSLNYRVQALRNGKPLWQYGKPIPADQAVMYSGEDRKFGLPASIAADDNGYLYVVDGLSSELIVLDTNGQFVERVGDVGHDDGTFYYPDGIAYRDGRLAIADKFNDRVEIFSVPVAAVAWRSYLPYGLLLLLLPLLAFLFRRGGVKYVAGEEFVERLGADENRRDVAAALKRLHVAPEVASAAIALEDVKMDWRKRTADADQVSGLEERFGLTPDAATSLAIAAGMRGKRVLLTDDAALREAAAQLGVPTVGYAEISATLGAPAEEGGEA